jgi:hypothetical protein
VLTASLPKGEAQVRSRAIHIESWEFMGLALDQRKWWLEKESSADFGEGAAVLCLGALGACATSEGRLVHVRSGHPALFVERLWRGAGPHLRPLCALLQWDLVLPKIDSLSPGAVQRRLLPGASGSGGEKPIWVQRRVTECSRLKRGVMRQAKLWKGCLLEARVPLAGSFGHAADAA